MNTYINTKRIKKVFLYQKKIYTSSPIFSSKYFLKKNEKNKLNLKKKFSQDFEIGLKKIGIKNTKNYL